MQSLGPGALRGQNLHLNKRPGDRSAHEAGRAPIQRLQGEPCMSGVGPPTAKQSPWGVTRHRVGGPSVTASSLPSPS